MIRIGHVDYGPVVAAMALAVRHINTKALVVGGKEPSQSNILLTRLRPQRRTGSMTTVTTLMCPLDDDAIFDSILTAIHEANPDPSRIDGLANSLI